MSGTNKASSVSKMKVAKTNIRKITDVENLSVLSYPRKIVLNEKSLLLQGKGKGSVQIEIMRVTMM